MKYSFLDKQRVQTNWNIHQISYFHFAILWHIPEAIDKLILLTRNALILADVGGIEVQSALQLPLVHITCDKRNTLSQGK